MFMLKQAVAELVLERLAAVPLQAVQPVQQLAAAQQVQSAVQLSVLRSEPFRPQLCRRGRFRLELSER